MRWTGPLRAQADDTTEDLLFEASVRALLSGVLFGVVMVLLNGPGPGVIAGVLFTAFMLLFFAGYLLVLRARARRGG
jgi:hypothetical protein